MYLTEYMYMYTQVCQYIVGIHTYLFMYNAAVRSVHSNDAFDHDTTGFHTGVFAGEGKLFWR